MKRFLLGRWGFLLVGLVVGGLLAAVAVAAPGETPLEDLATYTPVEDSTDELEGRINALENELSTKDDRISHLEDALRKAREDEQPPEEEPEPELPPEPALTGTIPEGIFQAGPGGDFPPGIYRAPGGGNCYWARLRSADTNDIIVNGGFSKNQTVQINPGEWFESSTCGTWERIG